MKIESFLSYYIVIYGMFGCMIFFNIIEHKMCVFTFSTRRIQQGVIIEHGSSHTVSVILVRFKFNLILSAEF